MAGVVNQQKCTFHAATAYVHKPWRLLPVQMFQILISQQVEVDCQHGEDGLRGVHPEMHDARGCTNVT